jgi:hypothetical protein
VFTVRVLRSALLGGFNKKVELLNEESKEKQRRVAAAAAAARAATSDVSDAEMASKLKKGGVEKPQGTSKNADMASKLKKGKKVGVAGAGSGMVISPNSSPLKWSFDHNRSIAQVSIVISPDEKQ